MSPPALIIRGLAIREGHGALVVAGVDLEVEAGGTLVLIGETGSGKSLIAQAVMGLLPQGFAASGTIAINGHAPVDAGQAGLLRLFWSRETMLLPQEPRAALDPTMRIGRQLFERTRQNDAVAALQAVGLAPEIAQAYPPMLSGGMAQRVLVASVLVGRAPLLIADEPSKGLDSERLGQTRDLLLSLGQAGRALLVITHDIALARALGGRLAVLREGRIVEQGESAAVFAAPRQSYTRAWIEADPSRWRPSLRCCAVDAPVLAGHGLRFGFRDRPALFEGLDIHVPRGGVLALTGPSGCGKTTLGNILLGLQAPDAGQVSWAGCDPYRDRAALKRLRRRYQKLHQDPASVFLPGRSTGLQLADLKEVAPELDLARDLPPLLERLRLDPRLLRRQAGEVSGGEAQRLALARILLMKPELIVADEPTSRLDPLVQRETIALLREIVAGEGVGLVLIGHDRALLAATADDVITIGR
ncbi:peptide/nickel transport system ATP-binding protein [Bosea sp. OK403]|uniref:ABC transporter ATP-binding protein n=1 Tax=Bosea sp. OK403 TaxID=1855286 RepID=UPI0008EC1E5A|nr:ATP-binding cassette domain-containing protein [Bosea sp. OK403]SFJ05211.1 peptide/nickel transport system ATP-binding protein [Bosea sp. OK403]